MVSSQGGLSDVEAQASTSAGYEPRFLFTHQRVPLIAYLEANSPLAINGRRALR
jgi:hypothetical protein